MDAIVLAAGKATRMAPLCTTTPKPILPVAGRSLLWRNLDALQAAGCTRAIVVIGHQADTVKAHAKAWRGAMKVSFALQKEPKGTGHAVAAAARQVRSDCLLVMGDGYCDPTTLVQLARAEGFVVAAHHLDDTSRYGRLQVQKTAKAGAKAGKGGVSGGRVTGIAEKDPKGPPGWINTGIYRVPRDAVKATLKLKLSPRGEYEFTDVLQQWADAGNMAWIPCKGWLDVGVPWDLLGATETLLPGMMDLLLGEGIGAAAHTGGTGTIEPGVHVRGRLYVEGGAVVKSGVYVEGDVYIAADSRIGPNAYLRGPTVIGKGCHVGHACEIKASVLLDGANAPHLNYVGDSVLGEKTNLGAGTCIANLKHSANNVRIPHRGQLVDTGRRKFGAILGDGAKTGINSSLDPGTLVEAGAWTAAGSAVKGLVARSETKVPAKKKPK